MLKHTLCTTFVSWIISFKTTSRAEASDVINISDSQQKREQGYEDIVLSIKQDHNYTLPDQRILSRRIDSLIEKNEMLTKQLRNVKKNAIYRRKRLQSVEGILKKLKTSYLVTF